MPKLNKFKYEFCKKEKLNGKYKNKGSKLNPAAAGDGTPVKYTDESIGLLVMQISAVKRANLRAEHATKNKVILHPNEDKLIKDQK